MQEARSSRQESPTQRHLWRQPLGLLHHSRCPTAGQGRTREGETKRLQTRNTGENQLLSRIPFPSKTSLSKRQLIKYLLTLSHIVDRDLRGKNWQVTWDSKRHCRCSTTGKTARILVFRKTVLSLLLLFLFFFKFIVIVPSPKLQNGSAAFCCNCFCWCAWTAVVHQDSTALSLFVRTMHCRSTQFHTECSLKTISWTQQSWSRTAQLIPRQCNGSAQVLNIAGQFFRSRAFQEWRTFQILNLTKSNHMINQLVSNMQRFCPTQYYSILYFLILSNIWRCDNIFLGCWVMII